MTGRWSLILGNRVVERATGTRDGWHFVFRGPDHGNLSAFDQTLQDHGISSTVRSFQTVDSPTRDAHGLTDKQRHAVELALREGHFSVPRETTLSELAERTDVSRQALSRRLDRGLANILAGTPFEDQREP